VIYPEPEEEPGARALIRARGGGGGGSGGGTEGRRGGGVKGERLEEGNE